MISGTIFLSEESTTPSNLINQETKNQQSHVNDPEDHPSTIKVLEEQLKVEKRELETGRVRITKKVIEHTEDIDIPLVGEEVSVERVLVNKYIEGLPPQVRYEGEKMIIPVVKEVLVVEKKLLLVEELWVTKHQVHNNETQQVSLKKEEVTVERVNSENIK